MKSKSTHVVPDPEGGWRVEEAGAKGEIAHYQTKREAVSKARQLSEDEGSELVIHDKHGRIERKDSHGHDPRNIRG